MTTPLPLRSKPARRSGLRPARRHVASWYIVLFVAALGFVLRAVVPAGFMPDAPALQAGHIELRLCSPGKMGRSVVIDWSANDEVAADLIASPALVDESASSQPGGSLASPADCPFSLMAAQGILAPPDAAVLTATASLSTAAPLTQPASPSWPAEGPPLGSRAPPAAV